MNCAPGSRVKILFALDPVKFSWKSICWNFLLIGRENVLELVIGWNCLPWDWRRPAFDWRSRSSLLIGWKGDFKASDWRKLLTLRFTLEKASFWLEEQKLCSDWLKGCAKASDWRKLLPLDSRWKRRAFDWRSRSSVLIGWEGCYRAYHWRKLLTLRYTLDKTSFWLEE